MHQPVLLQEVIDGLHIQKGDCVLDATLGGGGYSAALCERIGQHGVLIGCDEDRRAVERTRTRLETCPCTKYLFEENFRHLDRAVRDAHVTHVDAVVFDLGLSSWQLEDSGRGFSFQRDEPLLMTFKEAPADGDLTAEYIVNTWSEESLANVFYGYGNESRARVIARHLVEVREQAPITTSQELARIVTEALPKQRGKIHPATKVFQALRIAVNDEVAALEEGLEKAQMVLRPGGRVGVVSFHSIEDRIVKHFFAQREKSGEGMRLTKKPITPSVQEVQANPRSRSAKLRIFQKN